MGFRLKNTDADDGVIQLSDDFGVRLGARIGELRQLARLTVPELAARSNIGRRYLEDLEKGRMGGKNGAGVRNLKRLADALDRSVADFFEPFKARKGIDTDDMEALVRLEEMFRENGGDIPASIRTLVRTSWESYLARKK